MKITRNEFFNSLKIASAALGVGKVQVSELANFWFDGDCVSAYNDILGIQVSLETDFDGGVSGEQMLGVLDKSRAQQVSLLVEDDNKTLLMKAGSANIKFGTHPLKDWEGVWEPKLPKNDGFPLTKEFLQAVDLTLMSVGTAKVLTPEQRGVTIIQNETTADLFTTDAVTMSWMKVPTGKTPIVNGSGRCILSTVFCEQLKRIRWQDASIYITEDSAYCSGVATIVPGDKEKGTKAITASVILFGKLIEDENPIPFHEHISRHVKKGNTIVPVPSRMKQAIDRALVLLSDKEPVNLEMEEGTLYLSARGENTGSEIEDAVKLDDNKHPDIKIIVDPTLLRRGLEGRETMTLLEDAVVMFGPKGFIHLVSTK